MAAPGSVYSPKIWYKYDTGEQDNKGILIQLPRALQQYAIEANTDDSTTPPTVPSYSNLTTAQKTTNTDIWFCNIFHLDKVTHYNYTYTPSGGSATTMYCLCGWLLDTQNGSVTYTDNWNLHNMTNSRNGKPRITCRETIGNTTHTRSYVLCNDGGLNTRTWAKFSNYDPDIEGHQGNVVITASRRRLTFRMNYRNAYYCPTYKIQVQVHILTTYTGGTPSVATRTFDIPNIETNAKYDVYASEDNPFIATIPLADSGQGWPDFDAQGNNHTTFEMKLIAKNPEGDYETAFSGPYTVMEEPESFRIYRLDDPNDASTVHSDANLSKDPNSGIPYDIILDGWYTGLGDPASPWVQHGYYRAASHDNDTLPSNPPEGHHEYNYPTIYNLMGGVPYQWSNAGTPGAYGVSAGTQLILGDIQIHGVPASEGSDPALGILPAGMYSRIPTVYPRDMGQENVSEGIWLYIPRARESDARVQPIVYIDSTGHPYMWKASNYGSGGGGGGTPTPTAQLDAITLEVGESDGYVSSATLDQINEKFIYNIFPVVTVTGTGTVSVPVRCKFYYYADNYSGTKIYLNENSTIVSTSISLGNTTNTVTIPVVSGTPGGGQLPIITGEIYYSGLNSAGADINLYAELSIIDTGNWDGGRTDPDKIYPTPTTTWAGYPFIDGWNLAEEARKSDGGGKDEPK